MVEKMIDGIEVKLNTDYLDNKDKWDDMAERVVYTGPIDAYFDYKLGVFNIEEYKF